MSTLWIREYSSVPLVNTVTTGGGTAFGGSAAVPMEPGADQSPVTFSTSNQSAAFANGTTYIAMIADAAFHYVVGSNPTATTNALKVPADTLVFIGVTAGQKVAAIAAA